MWRVAIYAREAWVDHSGSGAGRDDPLARLGPPAPSNLNA